MTQLVVSFILDVIVASLLSVTIVYCWRLNKRIRVLQDSKGELAQLIRQFDESTERTSHSIQELQTAGRKITDSISSKIEKANYIADDLSFMIDKGARIADQMEVALAHSRKADMPVPQRAAATQQQAAPAKPVAQPQVASQAPAPRQAPAQQAATLQQKVSGLNSQSKAAASLESVLDRISGKGSEAPVNSFPDLGARKQPVSGASVRLRSKAEQELFDAIKTTRQ